MTEAVERPEVVTISGVEVVTIPLAHYAALLDCQRRMLTGAITPQRLNADLRCRIDRDPEVASFLADCLGRMLLKEAVAACRDRFGPERSPPQSTIQRYWARLRETSGGSARRRNQFG